MTLEILIRKSERTLEVLENGKVIKTCRVALGPNPVGDKQTEGDGRTPEGEFYVFTKNPKSKYFLSLAISYPSLEAANRGLERSLISEDDHTSIRDAIAAGGKPPQKTALGGEIYIHGGGTASDWTEGCIALENGDMRELFDLAGPRIKVVIVP